MDYLLEAAVLLLATVITARVIPWIKSRTTAEQQEQINKLVKTAVTAAEQMYQYKGYGAQKKAFVLNFLAEQGIAIDEKRLDALIEAAVYALNTGVIPTE